jgi:uncharacterized repeat protein (TIGR01451 family)
MEPKTMSNIRRSRARAFALTLLLAAIASPGIASAQAAADPAPAEPLQITLTLQRISVDAQGNETLSVAEAVKPGDLLEYRAVYQNRSTQPLGHVAATLPVPAGMVYQARSADPSPAEASTGNGQFGAEPLTRTVKDADADGRDKVEPVPYREYRALRWHIETLAPGQSVSVAARVRVEAATDVTAIGGTP